MTYRGAQNLIKRGDEAGLRAALDANLANLANLANQNGWTILMLAAVEGDVPIGRLLIERGATIDTRNKKTKPSSPSPPTAVTRSSSTSSTNIAPPRPSPYTPACSSITGTSGVGMIPIS
jgi:ankyrin repeat protein